MALACPITEHPVGTGSFCRICGRDYVTVPDQEVAELPAPVEPPAAEMPVLEVPPTEPTLPDPSPFAELHVPTEPPAPVPPPLPASQPDTAFKHGSPDPVLDTGLIETRFAAMTAPEAPLGDLAAVAPVADPAEAGEIEPAEKAPRALPPTVAYALAGGGVGALLMALVDRLVL